MPEQNDAERQAEEILEAAYSEVRAEECPQGADCPTHFRVDEEFYDKPDGYARLINYVGDFAVVTEDNPQYENPQLVIRILLGQVTEADLPPRWATMILHVGKGNIGDLEGTSVEVRRAAFRYHRGHGVWDEIAGEHNSTVSLLEAGLIDVSEPFHLEF